MAGETTRNAISVDDIDASIDKVPEVAGTIATPRSLIPGMGWYAAGTDSEGNPLALCNADEG